MAESWVLIMITTGASFRRHETLERCRQVAVEWALT